MSLMNKARGQAAVPASAAAPTNGAIFAPPPGMPPPPMPATGPVQGAPPWAPQVAQQAPAAAAAAPKALYANQAVQNQVYQLPNGQKAKFMSAVDAAGTLFYSFLPEGGAPPTLLQAADVITEAKVSRLPIVDVPSAPVPPPPAPVHAAPPPPAHAAPPPPLHIAPPPAVVAAPSTPVEVTEPVIVPLASDDPDGTLAIPTTYGGAR